MQTLDDVKTEMGKLYDEVRSGATDVKTGAELANIAGKFLKAEQLQLARAIFESALSRLAQRPGELTDIPTPQIPAAALPLPPARHERRRRAG